MKINKHAIEKAAPYLAFGVLLADERQRAGILRQSELAKRIQSTQQTVSRWEAGLSRPRDKQIPLIASVLGMDADELLRAAGYLNTKVAATFDKPFPLEALAPDSFERFCLYFLSKMYPGADVHRAGETGHKQDGIDLDAIFPDGRCHTFQCKRVDKFGPQKVHDAVAAHIREAEKKIILLTRVASPQARSAIRQYKNWDIWDREDVSFHIRQLAKHEQIKLVDIFFRRQRFSLLGELEAGPWQTPDEFFAAFMSGRGAFSHAWNLVGRADETSELVQGLSDEEIQVVFLTGSGGAGKSRVLKEAVTAFTAVHDTTLVFLSPSEDATNKSLEDLGSGDKILVVDDAHDRRELTALFQYAANPVNRAKLLLSFRPYGLDHIRAQASNFALAGPCTREIKLAPLTLDQSRALAEQVLARFGGPTSVAEPIARLTRDCPLATVIGAEVVARDKRHFALIGNEDTFRATLIGRFRDIIAGDIGLKSDAEPIRKALNVIALLQPFHPEDSSPTLAAEKIEQLAPHEFARIVRLLNEAGVLFRRGGKYRLSPDLLGDHIIESSCITDSGVSTGYAEKVFEAIGAAHIENLLLNLGKLDWRRSNGDPSNSQLLDGIWSKLKPASDYSDSHIDAVLAVAPYQPAKALHFAESRIRSRTFLRKTPEILKYIAFNYEYVLPACECLWELGRSDSRPLSSNAGHPIRILAELCAVEPNKPFPFNSAVVDFGLGLFDRDDVWDGAYTPFDFLESILSCEGTTTTSNGKTASWNNFLVAVEFVAPLRNKVIDKAIGLLSHPIVRIGTRAAYFLQHAIRYPMHGGNETRAAWATEFSITLEKIRNAVRMNALDPLVLIELLSTVSWHAHFAPMPTSAVAEEIIALMPDSLDFRVLLGLVNGYGRLLDERDLDKSNQEREIRFEAAAIELFAAYPDSEALRAYIERSLLHIDTHAASKNGASSGVLYGKLVQMSPDFARSTIEDALTHLKSRTACFTGIALSFLLLADHTEGSAFIKRLLKSGEPNLLAAIGHGYTYGLLKPDDYGPLDLEVLRKLYRSADAEIVGAALGVLRLFAQHIPRLALNMIMEIDLSISGRLADDVLVLLHDDRSKIFSALTQHDVQTILDKLLPIPELNGHWIQTFLSSVSKCFSILCASFFIHRVEHSAATNDWNYRPSNFGPYVQVPLRFRESGDLVALLRQVAAWMSARDPADVLFHHRARELFDAMFSPFDDGLVEFLGSWLDVATSRDIQTICDLLHEADHGFIFRQKAFVIRLLERAKHCDQKTLDSAISSLTRSAISGMKSGVPGEPFPQDIEMKNNAESALKEIPRFSAAFELYAYVKAHAEGNISWSLKEAERYDD